VTPRDGIGVSSRRASCDVHRAAQTRIAPARRPPRSSARSSIGTSRRGAGGDAPLPAGDRPRADHAAVPVARRSGRGPSRCGGRRGGAARRAAAAQEIPKHLTVGVEERVDYRGEVLRALDEHRFLSELDALVDQGARGFVVSGDACA